MALKPTLRTLPFTSARASGCLYSHDTYTISNTRIPRPSTRSTQARHTGRCGEDISEEEV
eukprot:8344638-Ditylum_brightwellii.AAC.1